MTRFLPHTALSLLALLGLLLAGCGGEEAHGGSAGAPESAQEGESAAGVTYDDHGEPAGIHRYIRWSENVGQGAQPMGEIAFKNLAALGYRTILSVDGAMPEVELAAKHGLRYVHVPIGYDGVSKDAATKIVKSARVSDFPVYVHCHHGKHRGPCAAMLLRISEDNVDVDQAIKGLTRSGTSPNYSGLWEAVRAFVPPTEAELAAIKELPSKVVPQGLQASMVDCSTRWEHLKLCQEAGWKPSKAHPDVAPAHEARMLWELYREMARTDKESQAQGKPFLAYLKASEDASIALEQAIRQGDKAAANKHFTVVKNLCSSCHTQFRN